MNFMPTPLYVITALILFSCSFNNKMDVDSKRQEFVSQLKEIDWSEPEKIISMVEPGIELINKQGKASLGSSKLGGQPDLPDSIDWPTFETKPMVFYGQINLAEVKDLDQEQILPETGVLYFFSYFKKPENEFGAEYLFLVNKEEYKILYFDGDVTKLKARKFPDNLPNEYHFKEMPIDFQLFYQVPKTTETWKYEKAKLNNHDAQLYTEFTSQYDDCLSEMILATPCPIQYGVDYDWAFSYLNTIDYNDPKVKEKVDNLRPDFINLLSFSMMNRFDKIGISNCYFGVRKQDLKEKKFENVIFIMQDT